MHDHSSTDLSLQLPSRPRKSKTYPSPAEDTDHVYDLSSYDSPNGERKRRRRRRRRNSDPSSDRPNVPSKHRRRQQNASRSPSPDSGSDVEILPDRFDEDGQPLDKYGNRFRTRDGGREGGLNGGLGGLLGGGGGSGQQEMIERVVSDFGDVVDGKKTWKDLLRGFMEEQGSNSGSDGGRRRRR